MGLTTLLKEKFDLQLLQLITGDQFNLKGLTLIAPGFFGWCSTRGDVFHLPSITPLSLKLDYSNFVQNYFGIR